MLKDFTTVPRKGVSDFVVYEDIDLSELDIVRAEITDNLKNPIPFFGMSEFDYWQMNRKNRRFVSDFEQPYIVIKSH